MQSTKIPKMILKNPVIQIQLLLSTYPLLSSFKALKFSKILLNFENFQGCVLTLS